MKPWLKKLMVVPTTVEQARQIIRRNQAVIEGLGEIGPENMEITIPIGCPHCDDCSGRCECCAWRHYAANKKEYDYFCVFADFNGHTLDDVRRQWPISLLFFSHKATLLYHTTIAIPTAKEIQDCKDVIREFCDGHIEWCDEVIRRAKTWQTKRP